MHMMNLSRLAIAAIGVALGLGVTVPLVDAAISGVADGSGVTTSTVVTSITGAAAGSPNAAAGVADVASITGTASRFANAHPGAIVISYASSNPGVHRPSFSAADRPGNKLYQFILAVNAPLDTAARGKVFAHRGFTKGALENSFASFDEAMADGCPQVELDVHASKDGVLFVSHDANIKRITGVNAKISSLTAKQLDAIHMKNGEKMHRLSEVFDRYGTKMIYLVEFKDKNANAEAFYKLIADRPEIASHVEVHSFYARDLKKVHAVLPNMFTQLLVGRLSTLNKYINADYIDSIGLPQHLVSKKMVKRIHDAGKEVWPWTVDSDAKVKKDLADGVDGIITDLPSAVAIARTYR